jgi:multidrug resistance efflux pump
MPGSIYKGVVRSVAWGIDPGKATANGLQKKQPSNQWFEPARRIPVHIELVGGLENWPKAAKAGGKVAAVVYSSGQSNPVAWLSYAIFRVKSVLSYLY